MSKWEGRFFDGERRVKLTGNSKAEVQQKREKIVKRQLASILDGLNSLLDDSKRPDN